MKGKTTITVQDGDRLSGASHLYSPSTGEVFTTVSLEGVRIFEDGNQYAIQSDGWHRVAAVESHAIQSDGWHRVAAVESRAEQERHIVSELTEDGAVAREIRR